MKKKIALIVIIVVLALCSMSLSYANDNLIAFVGCDSWDNETYKFIGDVNAYIDLDGQLNISITDAYPQYEAYVNFTIKNIGHPEDPTVLLNEIEVINGNESALSIVVTDLDGNPIPVDAPIDPGETLDGLVTISVLNEIEESHTYSFGVKLKFDYDPPPP